VLLIGFLSEQPELLLLARALRRKSAIVLKSGIKRPVSHINSMLRGSPFERSDRLDAIEIAVVIDL